MKYRTLSRGIDLELHQIVDWNYKRKLIQTTRCIAFRRTAYGILHPASVCVSHINGNCITYKKQKQISELLGIIILIENL